MRMRTAQGGVVLPDGYFSVKETAIKTGCSESQLRRYDKSGMLKPSRISFGKSEYRAYSLDEINVLIGLKSNAIDMRIASLRAIIKNLEAEKARRGQ